MKKLLYILLIIVLLEIVPVNANKPGRIKELETRVKVLEHRVEGLQKSYEYLLSICCEY